MIIIKNKINWEMYNGTQPLGCGTGVHEFVFRVGATSPREEKKIEEPTKLSSFKAD